MSQSNPTIDSEKTATTSLRLAEALATSQLAAEHLEKYRPETSRNFELALHIGKLVAQCDEPVLCNRESAPWMRPDDYVVGLIAGNTPVAFPMWVADYYHVINCKVENIPIIYTTCERCQSGSAFVSEVNGRSVIFSAMGMYNASLTMTDRAGFLRRPGSLWLHYEGIAIDGPSKGHFLKQIPTWHMSWAEWLELHPQSLVMGPPEDPLHRDARHGHGREEYFERPGMDRPLVLTITGNLDDRYPENEIVLGINADHFLRAYPLKEVKRSGSVVHDSVGQQPIVIFAGPKPQQVTLAAYLCEDATGRKLTFECKETHFVDLETGSSWNIEGVAFDGPLKGTVLPSIRGQYVRWHAWFYPHRSTQLYLHQQAPPTYPQVRAGIDPAPFKLWLDAFSKIAEPLVVDHELPGLALPLQAKQGIRLLVGNDRLNLFAFESATAAEDYVSLEGAWFCQPISPKLGRKPSMRFGSIVLESDPAIQYADITQFVRLPDPHIQWAALLNDPRLKTLVPEDSVAEQAELAQGFSALIRHLRASRYDLIENAFLPRIQLPVGSLSAIASTINADRFAIYRFPDSKTASSALTTLEHAFAIGPYVFRSTPVVMYEEPNYEMGQLPDSQIQWSSLLNDERFKNTLVKFIA